VISFVIQCVEVDPYLLRVHIVSRERFIWVEIITPLPSIMLAKIWKICVPKSHLG